jgi:hypothetical protein
MSIEIHVKCRQPAVSGFLQLTQDAQGQVLCSFFMAVAAAEAAHEKRTKTLLTTFLSMVVMVRLKHPTN